MCTAVEETKIESILAVMNTTELVVDLNPGPLRYRCSVLPTELTLSGSNIMTSSQLAC